MEERKNFGFGVLIDILKKNPKTIVLTEGTDPRILEASSRLLASNFLHPILVGDPDKIYEVAEESGFNIRGSEIINPRNFDRMDEMVEMFCELRKSKGVTPEQAREILYQNNYFGTMLVKMGIAIGIYILIRFRNIAYSIGSVAALAAATCVMISGQ